MVAALSSLLESGANIGIATGRGKSVRKCLHEALPKKYWPQVTVGYYNGGQILPLHSDELPDGTDHVAAELTSLSEAIQADRLLAQGSITLRCARSRCRPHTDCLLRLLANTWKQWFIVSPLMAFA